MAKYLGIDYQNEFGLLEIAKAAVNAPLPPEWENYEDENGEIYYYNKVSKQHVENHPLDGFFIEVVRQRRAELLGGHELPAEPGIPDFWTITDEHTPFPWMEFVDRHTGGLYYYNFVQDAICHYHPCHLIRHLLRSQAAVRIQALWRGFYVRWSHEQLVMKLAATDIQRMWRGHKARERVTTLRNADKVTVATTIQKLWRGHRVRMDRFMKVQNINATKIQATWRAYIERRRVWRDAQQPVLPKIMRSPLYQTLVTPMLSIAPAMACVQQLSSDFLQMRIPRDGPLESVDKNGDPISFWWMRIPEKDKMTGTGRRRPTRAGSAGSQRLHHAKDDELVPSGAPDGVDPPGKKKKKKKGNRGDGKSPKKVRPTRRDKSPGKKRK